MPICTLDDDGQKRLEFVLRRMKDDQVPITCAINEALSDVQYARRIYLLGELVRRAKQRLRAQEKKEASELLTKLMNDQAVQSGAWGHEKELLSRLPEKDQ